MATLAEGIRSGAGLFADSATILAGVMEYKSLNHVFIAAVVMRALSCELYLKALLAFSGRNVEHIHKLYILYSRLDDADQIAIKNFFVAEYKKTDPDFLETDFDKLIQEISNAFVEWRYFYENNNQTLNLSCLQTFCEALQHRIAELDVK